MKQATSWPREGAKEANGTLVLSLESSLWRTKGQKRAAGRELCLNLIIWRKTLLNLCVWSHSVFSDLFIWGLLSAASRENCGSFFFFPYFVNKHGTNFIQATAIIYLFICLFHSPTHLPRKAEPKETSQLFGRLTACLEARDDPGQTLAIMTKW